MRLDRSGSVQRKAGSRILTASHGGTNLGRTDQPCSASSPEEDPCRTRSSSRQGSHEPTEHAKTPKKAAASGWIGSALEYYDFFIYAQAASLVFPLIFFPSANPQVAIVAAFATFGVGYAARPLGAFVLGSWGDKHGRKNVLVLCMLMMGGSTFLVALLPTYGTIGIAAPILLVLLRLIQGFAVGGEISGASAMIIEHAPFGRRGSSAASRCRACRPGRSSPPRCSCRCRR